MPPFSIESGDESLSMRVQVGSGGGGGDSPSRSSFRVMNDAPVSSSPSFTGQYQKTETATEEQFSKQVLLLLGGGDCSDVGGM